MDFVGGALPNVMFLVGVIAIGVGLGLEFKIVEVKGDLGRNGRIGAFGVGLGLIAVSIYLYLTPRPAATAGAPAAVPPTATIQIAQVAALPSATPEPSATAVPPTTTPEPSATAVPPTNTLEPPTTTLEPSATAVPPTATPEPPTATPEPSATAVPATAVVVAATPTSAVGSFVNGGVAVPDIRDLSAKDAEKKLRGAGLKLGKRHDECSAIGVSGDDVRKVRKDRISCQSVQPGTEVARDTAVDYVVDGKDGD
jgi:hypothetical protein